MRVHFLGDIMLGRGLERIVRKNTKKQFVESINNILPKEHICIANLEAPFTSGGVINSSKDSHLTFKIAPHYVSFLNEIGISVATLANNHISDYGKVGISNTISTLKEAKIKSTGAGTNIEEATNPVYLKEKNEKYAILAFNAFVPFSYRAKKNRFGSARFDRKTIQEAINKCEKDIDGIIITVHWGIDYHQQPVPSLLNLAKKIIDAHPKVMAIVGHHPHLQQPLIFYKNKPIFCSLGNFLFDEPFSLSRIGSILTLNIKYGKILDINVQYTKLTDEFNFELLKEPFLMEEKNRINNIGTSIQSEDDLYLIEDRKWIKYLIYQSIRHLSWNDFTYLIELYSLKNILTNLIKK